MTTRRSILNILKQAAVLGAVLILPAASWGAAVSILSYDITNASVSGCGSWSHSYSGTITANGGIGQIGCSLANYSGASGTLNDSVIGSFTNDTQLFDGEATITLHLSGLVTLNSVLIFGGDFENNSIPGLITGATLGFGGSSVALGSTNVGPSVNSGLANDLFTISSTALDGLTGDTLVLSNFTRGGASFYSITEIVVDGSAASVAPEPSTYMLVGSGLGGLLWLARRRRA